MSSSNVRKIAQAGRPLSRGHRRRDRKDAVISRKTQGGMKVETGERRVMSDIDQRADTSRKLILVKHPRPIRAENYRKTGGNAVEAQETNIRIPSVKSRMNRVRSGIRIVADNSFIPLTVTGMLSSSTVVNVNTRRMGGTDIVDITAEAADLHIGLTSRIPGSLRATSASTTGAMDGPFYLMLHFRYPRWDVTLGVTKETNASGSATEAVDPNEAKLRMLASLSILNADISNTFDISTGW